MAVAGGGNRWRGWVIGGALAAAGVVAGLAVAGGFYAGITWTDSLQFCTSCHEMGEDYAEYQQTIHYKNAFGVRATCADCHVPKELGPLVWAKVLASNDLLQHFLGTIDTKEKFEANRLRMAKIVWADMEADNSRECRSCHEVEAMDLHAQTEQAKAVMQPGLAAGQTCISCHKGIAHHLPDTSQSLGQQFDDLLASAKQQGAKSDVLWTLTTKAAFVAKPSGTPEGAGDARLLPLTPVHVLKREGGWLQVQIDGWQQQGADRVLYAARGQRILQAVFGNAALADVKQLDTETDPETKLVWHKAQVVLWTSPDALLADRTKIMAYGAELFGSTCGACHAPPPPNSELANQWIGTTESMKQNVSISDEQFRFLQKYLQLNASDTAGHL
jgi:trimethylamine-N-oxide reductase cytochrome c-type subunit TorC